MSHLRWRTDIMIIYTFMGNRKVASSSSNGGMFGSGVFGMFGSTVMCKSEDKSIYCQIIKLFNLLIILFVVIFVIIIVYNLVIKQGKSRSGIFR
jgi:hypothetical protein